MPLYKTILLTVDIAAINSQTVEAARELAYLTKARLHIVYVVEPLPLFEHGFLGDALLLKQVRADLNDQFNHLANHCEIPENHRWFELGNAKKKILQVAQKIQADCIVIASHDQNAMIGLLGTTAIGVAQGAQCAVMITPGAGESAK